MKPSATTLLSGSLLLKFSFIAPIFMTMRVAATELPLAAPAADLILRNGKIYTDPIEGKIWNQALSIRAGDIMSIGSNIAIDKERGPQTKIVDLKGQVVLPGFNDGQAHLINGGLQLLRAKNNQPAPASPADEIRQAFKAAQEEAIMQGITSLQGLTLSSEEELRALQEAYANKQLQLRLSVWGQLEKPQELLALHEKYKNLPEEWVRLDTVKGVIDGSLNSRKAALIDYYSDSPDFRGEPLYSQGELNDLVLNANRLGLAVVLSASGDRAASMALNAFANARHLLFNSRVRNIIESLEVVPPFIYDKFRQTGTIAVMMPASLTPVQLNEAKAHLGAARIKHSFAWKNFLAAKIHMSFGSDWPTMPLSPLAAISPALQPPPPKITIAQAIDAYTVAGAYATREDHVKGTLREGKYADLVILTKDPFSLKGKSLSKTSIFMTIVGGKIVYDASGPAIKAAL